MCTKCGWGWWVGGGGGEISWLTPPFLPYPPARPSCHLHLLQSCLIQLLYLFFHALWRAHDGGIDCKQSLLKQVQYSGKQARHVEITVVVSTQSLLNGNWCRALSYKGVGRRRGVWTCLTSKEMPTWRIPPRTSTRKQSVNSLYTRIKIHRFRLARPLNSVAKRYLPSADHNFILGHFSYVDMRKTKMWFFDPILSSQLLSVALTSVDTKTRLITNCNFFSHSHIKISK